MKKLGGKANQYLLIRKVLTMDEPILITGAARSGTSLVAGVLNICGAWCGVVRGPNRHNQKGMFENIEIIQKLIKPLLTKVGADPLCQKPLPVTRQFEVLDENVFSLFRSSVIEIVKSQGYSSGPWFIKEPKMTMVWYVWAKAFPMANWIIVRRNVEDIVTSCIKTSFMKAYSTRPGWMGWVVVHEKRFEEMHNARLKIHQVWPQRMIDGDFTEMQAIINNLNLNWDFERVVKFVAPSLWHKTKKTEESENGNQSN
jgi:hypothetical protein